MSAWVLFYHRVFPDTPASDVTVAEFEWQMDFLARRCDVVSLEEVAAHARGERRLARPSVAITFDDGWFDNFVYAYPVLKRRGLRATVFVATGQVAPGEGIRPTLEDCWQGRADPRELQRPLGVQEGFDRADGGDRGEFLTWAELRVMQASGVFAVESHGVGHPSGFRGDEVLGFGDGRPRWPLRSALGDPRPGVPVYRVGSALGGPVFQPDPGLADHLAGVAAGRGGERFLEGPGAEAVLRGEAARYRAEHPGAGGRWETHGEARRRIAGELRRSREALREELGRDSRHLCWPWGEWGPAGLEAARDAGFEAGYTTTPGVVTVGADPFQLPRVSAGRRRGAFRKRCFVYARPALARWYLGLRRAR